MDIYKKTTKLCVLGMLSALSIVLVFLVRVPILPEAPYLEYDPADIPILIAAYLYGPYAALAVTFVVCVIQGVTVSASSGIIGILMHFFATGAMSVTVGMLSERGKFNIRTFFAAIAGAVMMVLIMIPLNMVFTPLYTGFSTKTISSMILPIFIPFNTLKSGINTVISMIVYGALIPALKLKRETKC